MQVARAGKGDAGGIYVERDGTLVVEFREHVIAIDLTSTQLRKLGEEMAEAAIRKDLRGAA